MTDEQAAGGCGSGPVGPSAGAGPRVEFGFGAAFTSVRTIPLRVEAGERLEISDMLPGTSGLLWVADARARALKVYSQQGWRVRSLDREGIGLRRPVSLAALHERWVAVLDGGLPAVAILDEGGRLVRRFPLPELDRPLQICNLADRRLAVVGPGWGPGRGRLVHLYTTAGDYIESLFAEPRDARSSDRAYVAAAGDAFYLAHSRRDSFVIYDVEARAVLAFPRQGHPGAAAAEVGTGQAAELVGLFATACGPLLALYSGPSGYLYDLYALDGAPITVGLASEERVIGVEGPFFYSLCGGADGAPTLRVWKLAAGWNSPLFGRSPRLSREGTVAKASERLSSAR